MYAHIVIYQMDVRLNVGTGLPYEVHREVV